MAGETLLTNVDVRINGKVFSYEANVKITPGSATREPHPQVNGKIIYTTDISTEFSEIVLSARLTDSKKKLMRELYANGETNIITAGDKNFSRCVLVVLPQEEDNEVVEYVFNGNPEV